MTRRHRAPIFYAGIVLLVGWAAIRFWPQGPAAAWSEALAAKVRLGRGTAIDFAEIAPDPWERVHIFGPYASARQIDSGLGFHWKDAQRSSIETNDAITLVVFVRNGQVIAWFEHPRNEGDLVPVVDSNGYPRAQARFHVEMDETGRFLVVK